MPKIVQALQSAIDNLCTQFQKDLQAVAAEEELSNNVNTLDPTQFEAYKYIAEWSEQRLLWRQALPTPPTPTPPRCRLLLLGTAGTGKTHTAKLAITKARRTLGSFQSVLTVAFSGVAAANLGGGARTVDSIFHTNTKKAAQDLKGSDLDDLVALLRDVELLVIDEISTVGAAAFELISRRLEQVGKVLWLQRFGTAQTMPDNLGGFGGIGVVLIGDFAQLPPVLSSSLLSGTALQEGKTGGLRSLALTGRQNFAQFEDVIRLRRIHRILGKDPYKETTMRLRDAAITVEDHILWKSHELEAVEPDSASSEPSWLGAENLLREALVLVTDNAQAGRINGRRLTDGVPLLTAPSSASVSAIVVRCEASHNDARGESPKADEFRNVRKAVHLRVGARVILITNNIWGVNTVPLGLMNGARGVVVAIVYASSGAARVDGNALATTGWPSSDGSSFPRGLHRCPMPDYVVVHFPTYKGSALFSHGLPKTWVPIPCVEVRGSTRKNLCRVGLPLKLAWCLTIHKSQGITANEGTIVSFKDSKMPCAVSKLGLAFVAWTRATTWSKIAFQSLPPLEEFLAVRLTKDFQMREAFEIQADVLHDAFLRQRGITEEAQLHAHSAHLQATLQRTEAREATADELRDLEAMLQQHGVAPVSESVQRWGQERLGRKGGAGLWSIVSSFRADKVAKDVGDKKRKTLQKQNQIVNDMSSNWTTALLKEHGYDDETIEEAIEHCGCNVLRCVEQSHRPDHIAARFYRFQHSCRRGSVGFRTHPRTWLSYGHRDQSIGSH